MGKKFNRILLKLSGEALQNKGKNSIDQNILISIAEEIKEVKKLGIEIAIVVGGGNIFRGFSASINGMDRSTADYMGMLATIFNSLALQEALERVGVSTRVQSAIEMNSLCEFYIRRKAIQHLKNGKIVIFAGGTGNPYFTTDTAASLRANEINADAVLKSTKVDGVFDSDPLINKDAKMYKELSYIDVLSKKFKIMDSTSISMCMDNNIVIYIFNMMENGNIKKILEGHKIGTIIHNKKES